MLKFNNFITKNKAKLTVLSLAFAGGLLGKNASAAVDSDVASATATVVSTIKENIIGAISINVYDIFTMACNILCIYILYKLAKHFYY